MGNLWELPVDSKGMTGFTRKLGFDIENRLGERGYGRLDVEVNYSDLDKSSGYILSWNYRGKHGAELMITKSDGGRILIIDRFWAIKPCQISRGGVSSSPDELRSTAQIYDEIENLLDEKFGKPISEHDGRSIYRTKLEEKVTV